MSRKPAPKAKEKSAKQAPAKQAKKAPVSPLKSLKKVLGLSSGKSAEKAKPDMKQTKGGKAPVAVPAKSAKAQPAKLDKKAVAQAAKETKETKKGGKQAAQPAVVETGKKGKGAAARASAKEKAEASGAAVCREVACELMATTGGYCRMHYIKNWKKVKRKEMILKERKLNHYIEELVSKYPDKYIEAIRQDLASEKDFAKVISDLEIEESVDDFETVETESAEGIIDNLKRDFEDEGETF